MSFDDGITQDTNKSSYKSLKTSIASRTDGLISDKAALVALRADVDSKSALFGQAFLDDIDAVITSIETRKSEY
jgi:hypothetical protein